MFPYIIQGSAISIVVDRKPYTINKTHITYDRLRAAIKAEDWNAVRELVEPKQVVVNYAVGNVTISGDQFFWNNRPMHNALSTKMIDMLREGFPIDPLVNFTDNLMQNPSKRAVDELYGFLEKGNLPITPDGHFLAYKKVREDYTDCHTGKISNHVGALVTMERNAVDDNRDQTCSTGLHFCSQEYLKSFGGARTMILKINPRDVVSIPSDYNDSKGRCCQYEVISELEAAPEKAFTKPVQANAQGIKYVEPKTGSTPFYHGYNDGYQGLYHASDAYCLSEKDRTDYAEGYSKGNTDRWTGTERYRYVPNQQLDTRGRALSMTKDAIRKREARARARAQAAANTVAATTVAAANANTGSAWPFPKA